MTTTVETPAPITMLESAMAALNTCTNTAGKSVHLSPRQALALLAEDERLKSEVSRQAEPAAVFYGG